MPETCSAFADKLSKAFVTDRIRADPGFSCRCGEMYSIRNTSSFDYTDSESDDDPGDGTHSEFDDDSDDDTDSGDVDISQPSESVLPT